MRVVDFGADGGDAASGESTVLVAGAQVAAQRMRHPVGVDGEHCVGDRVGDEAFPRGGVAGEAPGGGRVDGGASDEVARHLGAGQRERGDDDLHVGADRTQRAGGRVACVVEGWGAGEEQVGEDVGSDLVDGSTVGVDDVAGAFGACVDDRAGLAGEPVVDAFGDHGGHRGDDVAHAVAAGDEAHGAVGGGILVALGEGARVHLQGEHLDLGTHPVGGVAPAALDRDGFERQTDVGRKVGAGVDDDVDVRAGDGSGAPRRERGGVVLDDRAGAGDAALHGTVGEVHEPAELGGDRPQSHVVRLHAGGRVGGLLLGELTRARKHLQLHDLRPGEQLLGHDRLVRDVGEGREALPRADRAVPGGHTPIVVRASDIGFGSCGERCRRCPFATLSEWTNGGRLRAPTSNQRGSTVTSVAALFTHAGVRYAGAVRWGEAVPLQAPGVYVVSTNEDPQEHEGLAACPLDHTAIEALLKARPEATVDGSPATVEGFASRLVAMWPGREPVVYIGLAGTSVHRRVDQFYRTPLGARGPHAGGWPVKMLSSDGLWVHFGPTDDPAAAESAMIAFFAAGVAPGTARTLVDPSAPLPFANLTYPAGRRKKHGLHGVKTARTVTERVSAGEDVSHAAAPGFVRRDTDSPENSGRMRLTQNITATDISNGHLRVPHVSKLIFPTGKALIEVELGGESYTASWDPRTSGDKERSGIIRVGRAILRNYVTPGAPRRIETTDTGYRIS